MLQDVEAGRQTEIDFLNGAIVSFGERYGVDAPLNRALTALIKGKEFG
jgi:2-dehydropantoate 2-reductase